MFVVAFRQTTHRSWVCRDVTHVEVGVTGTNAIQIAVVKEVALGRQ